MRKLVLLATAVAAVFGVVAVAQAANVYSVTTARVTPTKAGTATKPKHTTINFGYGVTTDNGQRPSVTTDYVIRFGSKVKSNRGLFTGKTERKLLLRPSPAGLAFSRETDGTPVLDVKNLPEPYDKADAWKGKTLTVIVPTDELRGLVAYIQKLGTNRGAWRDVFEPQTLSASVMEIPRTREQEERGQNEKQRGGADHVGDVARDLQLTAHRIGADVDPGDEQRRDHDAQGVQRGEHGDRDPGVAEAGR